MMGSIHGCDSCYIVVAISTRLMVYHVNISLIILLTEPHCLFPQVNPFPTKGDKYIQGAPLALFSVTCSANIVLMVGQTTKKLMHMCEARENY